MPKVEPAVDEVQRLTFAINAVLETLKHVREMDTIRSLLDALASLMGSRERLRLDALNRGG